jgi:DNA-binding transcriptional LysR family regulator
MDLRQFRYAEAVARHANFTRAAAELHIAQPALSMAVRNLEAELGIQLFERTSRHVTITDAGQAFLARARRIHHEVEDLAVEMAEYSGAVRGRVRLGSSYHLDSRLPELLRVFVRGNPLVDFSIVEASTPRMLDGLRSAELDAAFVVITPEIDLAKLEHVLVREEPLVMVVAPSDPFAALPSVHLDAMATRPYICCRVGTATRDWLDRVLARSGVQVRIACETNGVGAMVEFASVGLGATILTRSIVAALDRDVAMIPIDDAPMFKLGLAWRSDAYRAPAADRFIQLARRMLLSEGAVSESDPASQTA